MATLDAKIRQDDVAHAPRLFSPGASFRTMLAALPGGRFKWIVLAAAVVAAGLALNWSWLVAAGVAPLLLTAAPCVAMCALGFCMNRKNGRAREVEHIDHPKTHTS